MAKNQNPNVYVAAAGYAKRADSERWYRDPAFRKATLPMMMAWESVQSCLDHLTERGGDASDKSGWGLVFGTSHGELEVTRDFLTTLKTKGIARPILFQNSLHHSTLGFISLRLGTSGPGMTVSNHFFSGEDALASAMEMLTWGSADVVITVSVDCLVDGLESALGQYYQSGRLADEGAGSLLLANENGLKQLAGKGEALKPLAILAGVDCHYHDEDTSEDSIRVASDYDSDAIEKVGRYLREQPASLRRLVLSKPDRTNATITWGGV